MDQSVQRYHVFPTAGGFCGAAWNDVGITRFQLPTPSAAATKRVLLRRVPDAVPATPTPAVADAIAAATRYFAGEAIDFSPIELDLTGQDAFFLQIYSVVRQVLWGQTTTYGAVARMVGGGPETARDVGQAMARNPVPLIIPCHRVLAAGGKVGGFSAPGGAEAKLRMLALEGVQVTPAHAHKPAPTHAQQSLQL